jgi:MSHA pilin protein MshC
MNNIFLIKRPKAYLVSNKNKGFTIIELILVIILMGILAVTVAPKMFNTESFQEHAYQAEVISVLRNHQLKAMQQTSEETCHSIVITGKLLDVFTRCDGASQEEKDKEEANKDYIDGYGLISIVVIKDEGIILQVPGVTGASFSFDSLGRPVGCASPCQVLIQGSETLVVQIESEGFIHAL